eukprot:TRINITY_DN2244_c0_g1_i1.p1 TRINITY_DN2244_c0_g1~~TRINITY_DN2244_c0_g1_i1.p1  ORF type:complete len:222 (+),score=14.28 TRINITY_DN2244_c0_g1_i1:72-668(+)
MVEKIVCPRFLVSEDEVINMNQFLTLTKAKLDEEEREAFNKLEILSYKRNESWELSPQADVVFAIKGAERNGCIEVTLGNHLEECGIMPWATIDYQDKEWTVTRTEKGFEVDLDSDDSVLKWIGKDLGMRRECEGSVAKMLLLHWFNEDVGCSIYSNQHEDKCYWRKKVVAPPAEFMPKPKLPKTQSSTIRVQIALLP